MKAIVTGHTRGLGQALAQELMARGIAVLGLARGRAHALGQAFPGLLAEVEIDLADAGALQRWLRGDTLAGFFAGCPEALLLNNAGTVQPVGSLPQQDPAAVAQAVMLNVAAPLMLSAAVVAATPGAAQRIVHLSSGAARNPYSGWSIYCATKAALDHHARASALDAVKGLRICSLAPGIIDTDMQAEIRATPEQRFPMRARFVELKNSGALSTPRQCAVQVVDYLLHARFGDTPVDDLRSA